MTEAHPLLNLIDQEFKESIPNKWIECSGKPEATLLRLYLLRQLERKLHAEKSKYLALDLKEEIQKIKECETVLARLRKEPILEDDLPSILHQSPPPSQIKHAQIEFRKLPESIFRIFRRETFERFDREWETAIAAEALSLKWNLWRLKTWVLVNQVEPWEKHLIQKLWPHGLLLFAESGSISGDRWQGIWTLFVNPKFKHPQEIAPDLNTTDTLTWELLL